MHEYCERIFYSQIRPAEEVAFILDEGIDIFARCVREAAMSDIDLNKLNPILESVKEMKFDGRPALEAMRTDWTVFEAVRRVVREELAKIAYDPADDEAARASNEELIEIVDQVFAEWGPDPKSRRQFL